MKKTKYFMLSQVNEEHAELTIFGDITSWPWGESDVSAYDLSKQLKDITANHIDVHINSYGGEVAEGLAIYNSLKNHSAEVTTYCDGFACSIASVIFMAGDKRVMNPASLMMIHNPWSYARGNSGDLRKAADDLDVICEAIVAAYQSHVTLEEAELRAKLDDETWITPDDAISWGFATEKVEADVEEETIAASMGAEICAKLMAKKDNHMAKDDPLTVKAFEEKIESAVKKIIEAVKDNKKEEDPDDGEEQDTKTPNFLKAFFLSLDGRKEDE